MTLEKENEKKSKYDLTRFIIHLFKAKTYIILFTLLGFTFGIIFQPNKEELHYYVEGEIDPISSNGDVITYLLNSINSMDLNTKAKKLNISKITASNLLEVSSQVINTIKTPDIPTSKPKIKYNFIFRNLNSYHTIQKGIFHFINSDQSIKNDLERYLIRRKTRAEILQDINNEINSIQKRFTHKNIFEEYTKKSNADLYRLKLDMEFELSNPASTFVSTFQGIPELYSSKIKLISTRLLFSVIGALIGYLFYLMMNNKVVIKNEISLIIDQIKKR